MSNTTAMTKEMMKELGKEFPKLSSARITTGTMEGQRLIVECVKRVKGEVRVIGRKPGTTHADEYKVEALMAEHLCTAAELAKWDAMVIEREAAAAKSHAEWLARWAREAEGEAALAAYEAEAWSRAEPTFSEWCVRRDYASCTAKITGAPYRKAPRRDGDEPKDYERTQEVTLYINRRSERNGAERVVTYETQVNWSAIGSSGLELARAYAELISAAADHIEYSRNAVIRQMQDADTTDTDAQ